METNYVYTILKKYVHVYFSAIYQKTINEERILSNVQ